MRFLLIFSLIGGLLCGPAVIWAGEKEELQLQKQVLQERIEKFVTQNQLIQILFERAKQDFAVVEQKIKALEDKEKATKKPEDPK